MTFMFGLAAVGLCGRYHLGLEPPERPGDGVPPPNLSFHHDPALLSWLALTGRGYSGKWDFPSNCKTSSIFFCRQFKIKIDGAFLL